MEVKNGIKDLSQASQRPEAERISFLINCEEQKLLIFTASIMYHCMGICLMD